MRRAVTVLRSLGATVALVASLALGAGTALCASVALAQTLRRPVACDDCIGNWFYKDEDATTDATLDWSCGTSTYDGHRGSDFSLIGGNAAIDDGYDVVAAAGGMVVTAVDGFYDHCTSCPAAGDDAQCGLGFGGGFGNHVVIETGEHRTIYAHLRTGSVRVAVGDVVGCGDVIAQIGSSGCTTGAHLHFEVRPPSGTRDQAEDPFEGDCSATTPSYWTAQGSYRGMPEPVCDAVCPSGTYAVWTCTDDARVRCIDGVVETESCAPGVCVSRATGVDDACDADSDGVPTDEGDCDDHDASVHPGATELCGNAVDEDCDGTACAALDAGAPSRDAGPARDATTADASRANGRIESSCGCQAPGASTSREVALPMAALALLLARRRRPVSARSSGTRA